MLGTDFRTGSPNWLDLGSPDTKAAASFYQQVFQWEFVSAGPDTGDYGFFQLNGKTVAAMGPLTEQGATSAWMPHFHSPDLEATTSAVRAGGGKVRVEPMDVMEQGRLAQYTDPQGAEFACWQPAKTAGLELASAENSLVWVELQVPDPAEAITFYASLFGWRHSRMPAPGMPYEVLSIADGDQEEGSFGGIAPQGEGMGLGTKDVPRWVPYFHVTDVDNTIAIIKNNGGKVLMAPADVPQVGRIAWTSDPDGALFALLKPDPRM
ncbi:VOC family protein (plasmid) [Kitasatospora sp. NBC_00070]|uniref:VOC family protein n=1 Tax=Kitasatospora sp. NBC_00070 TaxID=2975962 RepID=UPI002F912913